MQIVDHDPESRSNHFSEIPWFSVGMYCQWHQSAFSGNYLMSISHTFGVRRGAPGLGREDRSPKCSLLMQRLESHYQIIQWLCNDYGIIGKTRLLTSALPTDATQWLSSTSLPLNLMRLKSIRSKTHPCLTPLFMRKKLDMPPPYKPFIHCQSQNTGQPIDRRSNQESHWVAGGPGVSCDELNQTSSWDGHRLQVYPLETLVDSPSVSEALWYD